ncbi:MAG TPA: bestrophin family ion channel [Gemmataceae bacterium]
MGESRRHFLRWCWTPPPIAPRLRPAVLIAVLYSATVYLVCEGFELGHPVWAEEVGVLNALIIGVLVGFRTKAAYDRWWEGRQLWGELTNQCRNLSLKAAAYAKPSEGDRRELARLLSAFPAALMLHLRGAMKLRDLPGFQDDPANPDHVPAYIAARVMALIASWRAADAIDGHRQQIIDSHASSLMNVCGACERIRNTPLPESYLLLLWHGLILSFIVAPWHLAVSLGAWAIAVQALLVYFFFGVELTAESTEQPFGSDPDDLPLERYCANIRASVEELLITREAGRSA